MAGNLLSNIPVENKPNSTVKFFDQYYEKPVELDNNILIAAKSFFEKRGFEGVGAELVASVILSQSKRDNINPIVVLDSLQGMNNVELSGLVAEVLNFNRFKTSNLGIYMNFSPPDEVQRNIIA